MINDDGRVAKLSVDGTDCSIYEPFPFDTKWWSHKTNGPALRYELGVAVQSNHIVWVNGPFPAGEYPDISIFRTLLKSVLKRCREKAICDGGYKGEPRRVQMKGDTNLTQETRAFNDLARARHETVNGRIKKYRSMTDRWRHGRDRHHFAFMAVVCLTQMELEYEPLFAI